MTFIPVVDDTAHSGTLRWVVEVDISVRENEYETVSKGVSTGTSVRAVAHRALKRVAQNRRNTLDLVMLRITVFDTNPSKSVLYRGYFDDLGLRATGMGSGHIRERATS